MNGETITISLTGPQRKLIDNLANVSKMTRDQFRFGVQDGKHTQYQLSLESLDTLIHELMDGAIMGDAKQTRELNELLGAIHKQITPPSPEQLEQIKSKITEADEEMLAMLMATAEPGIFEQLPPEQQDALRHFATLPCPPLLGLSLIEMTGLLMSDWTSPESVLLLNDNLSEEFLQSSPIHGITTELFDEINRRGSVAVTQKLGFLNRAFIKDIVLANAFLRDYMDTPLEQGWVMDEDGVAPIYIARSVLHVLDCIEASKTKCYTTPKGLEFRAMPPGLRFAFSFYACFRHVDLQAFDTFDEPWDALQDGLSITLYLLGRHCREWCSWKEAMQKSVTPVILNECKSPHANTMFYRRVIRPLYYFGLLEFQDDKKCLNDLIRVTPLYDALLSFDFSHLKQIPGHAPQPEKKKGKRPTGGKH